MDDSVTVAISSLFEQQLGTASQYPSKTGNLRIEEIQTGCETTAVKTVL